MKRSVLLLSLFSVLCVCAYAQDIQPAAKTATGPQLTFSGTDSTYDLGVIPLGSTIDNQVEIKNTGDAPLLITEVKSDSKYIQCKWPARVKAGKKADLTITYTAHGESGSFSTNIYITSNATATPMTFHITGANIPSSGMYMPAKSSTSKSGGRHSH